jgi:hypothetical protein
MRFPRSALLVSTCLATLAGCTEYVTPWLRITSKEYLNASQARLPPRMRHPSSHTNLEQRIDGSWVKVSDYAEVMVLRGGRVIYGAHGRPVLTDANGHSHTFDCGYARAYVSEDQRALFCFRYEWDGHQFPLAEFELASGKWIADWPSSQSEAPTRR